MAQAENQLSLLAKILSQNVDQKGEVDTIFDDIYTILNKNISSSLSKSTYSNKFKIIRSINGYLEYMEPIIQFKELIGKTIIGVLGSDKSTYKNLFHNLVKYDKDSIYVYNTNIPAIIHFKHGNEHIKLLNLLQNQVTLNKDEYMVTTRELYKRKIDIRKFIRVFSFNEELCFKNSVIVHFPDHSLRYEEYFKILKEYTDVMLLFADEDSNWKYNLEYLSNSNYKKEVYVFTYDKYVYIVKKIIDSFHFKKLKIHVCNINEDFQIIKDDYDKVRNNINISDYVLSILGDIAVYYTNFIKKQNGRLSNINKDLVNIESQDIGECIRKIKSELINNLNYQEKIYKNFYMESLKLLEKTNKLMNTLVKICDFNEIDYNKDIEYHVNVEELWVKIGLQMIQIENFSKVKDYIHKLDKVKFPYTFALKVFLYNKMKVEIPYEYIEKLSNTNSKYFLVIKCKIAFRDKIGISDEDAGELAARLNKKYKDKSYEYFLAGKYFEKSNITKAIQSYYDALDIGSIEAGKRLFELSKVYKEIDLEFLAQNMVPDANYELGVKALNNNKYAKGITNLKIAAALGDVPAIKSIASMEYNKIIKNYKYKYSNTNFSQKCNKLLHLYLYLYSKDNKDINIVENIGSIYFAIEDYRKALKVLEKCNSGYALFTCGRIYQYGKGTVPQDIYKAKKYFNSARKLGYKKAMVEYEKVCGWIEANELEQQSDDLKDYSTIHSYNYESSSGGLCFITTATCVALNKQDNCEELLSFKNYRDTKLINDKDGPKLIREYYRIAPSIVEAIEETKNPLDTYKKLWKKYIAIGYKYLLNCDYRKAKDTYINMVIELCNKYGILINK
ncbi:CFI-box-CTERM domain-containing protein [Clostridium tyrobutyricum]|uniref:CFI-box-CTERM domain-containing protein n=1 Tax=Clostridium tyrobutyricum TaxID=1519 RepID=UPI0011C7361B|nr:CFI-box-CTERM domain-containing protein [Clostridium tyrobutyricum]